jgi:hypothetical protein
MATSYNARTSHTANLSPVTHCIHCAWKITFAHDEVECYEDTVPPLRYIILCPKVDTRLLELQRMETPEVTKQSIACRTRKTLP